MEIPHLDLEKARVRAALPISQVNLSIRSLDQDYVSVRLVILCFVVKSLEILLERLVISDLGEKRGEMWS